MLALIAEGRSNRDIGLRLHISPHTAANHVRSILMKTGMRQPHRGGGVGLHRGLSGGGQSPAASTTGSS